ncbi:MAG TPA: class I SAM-dependent methyltransferase [Dongiaceae bacterium]|nr:class I SAM-dependent methyltransferase [Dongiaceae bacterium]
MDESGWNERYGQSQFRYGTEPNAFLSEVAARIPAGPVLCLADGEGRNGVFLAQRRHHVLSVDLSRVGLGKARRLAAERGVWIATLVADLGVFEIAPGAWSGIVSIWVHVSEVTRRLVHRAAVAGLAPGGAFVLEAYTPRQIERGTGGPTDPTRLMTLEGLREELRGLRLEIGREVVREVHEGDLHHGASEVVQVLAFKP